MNKIEQLYQLTDRLIASTWTLLPYCVTDDLTKAIEPLETTESLSEAFITAETCAAIIDGAHIENRECAEAITNDVEAFRKAKRELELTKLAA